MHNWREEDSVGERISSKRRDQQPHILHRGEGLWLVENKDISSVAISEDEKIIVMINEEDHIREQCIEKGFNLYKPYRRLVK